MIFIISQILGIISFIFSLLACHKKKKSNILSNMIISNILNLIHYLLLGALTGCITKIIAIIRDIFIIIKDKYNIKSNIPLFLFIGLYILIAIKLYTNIYSLFPIIAAIIYTIPIWNGNDKIVRKTAFLSCFFWLIYNICVFSIAGMLSNLISIISIGIAISRTKS